MIPALRNALTNASTRLSLTRARTRSIRAVCVDRVEARLDVGVQHPAVALGAEQVDLGDRVVRPPLRPEPVGDRHEVGLEDRFQHQLQRSLHHPVSDRRNAQLAQLPRPTGLGDHPFTHRQRPERPVLHRCAQIVQEPRDTDALDGRRRSDRPPRRVRAPVARDPVERHDQRRRVVHEIEQVIEPAARIGRRPTVQFGLHLRYPPERPSPCSGRRRHSAAHLSALQSPPIRYRCRPSPCGRLSRPRSTTATPPRPDPFSRRWTYPSRPRWLRRHRSGRPRRFPCSLLLRSIEEEPDSAPAASPWLRRRPSPWPPGRGLHAPPEEFPDRIEATRVRTAPGPDPPGSSRYSVEGLYNTGSSRTPLDHAHRTHAIWQC